MDGFAVYFCNFASFFFPKSIFLFVSFSNENFKKKLQIKLKTAKLFKSVFCISCLILTTSKTWLNGEEKGT